MEHTLDKTGGVKCPNCKSEKAIITKFIPSEDNQMLVIECNECNHSSIQYLNRNKPST